MVGFEAKIKQLCRERNVTQKELYAHLDISDAGMRKMYARNSCEVSLLEKIAYFFDVPITTFFDDGDKAPGNISAVNGDGNTSVAGNGNHVNSDLGKALEEIAAQRRVTEKAQEQIGRLLSIIENMK